VKQLLHFDHYNILPAGFYQKHVIGIPSTYFPRINSGSMMVINTYFNYITISQF